ncbi:MAG: hypothetical protein QG602_291 [Verrucomicrobiota bacterium]|nr:hypothetical protein [Verrucomicrobiota bacterium]
MTAVVVYGFLAVCLVRLAGLVRATAVNVPFQDQWDLLRPMFAGDGWWAAFRWQHGPHRQGLGGVINGLLYQATNWDVRAESWAAVAVLGCAALAAIVLARRLRGRPHWGDAAFPLIFMSPVHWETMILTPNLAHGILPVLLVLLLALAWTARTLPGRLVGAGVVGSLCLFTGFAFCAAFLSAGLAMLLILRPSGSETERRAALALLVIFALALVAFGWGYRWDPAVPGWRFPVEAWWDYPRFVALMFSSLLGWRAMGAGPVVLGGLFLGPVLLAFAWSGRELWARRDGPAVRAVWLLTGTSLAFASFTAIGRLPVNIEAAFMWRYLPLLTPAVAGLLIWAGVVVRPSWRRGGALLGLAVGAVVWGNFTPERHAAVIAEAKHRWIDAYLATRNLGAANQAADFYVYRGDPESPAIAERLRWLEQNRLSFFR